MSIVAWLNFFQGTIVYFASSVGLGSGALPFKISQWIVEIGFGIGLLLLSSTALMLAMEYSSQLPQPSISPQSQSKITQKFHLQA